MAAIKGLRNRWTKWRHGYITTEFDGIEIRIGIVPDPGDDDEEPEHFHATRAHLDEDGEWDWLQVESPDVPAEWSSYEAWWPRSYSLN